MRNNGPVSTVNSSQSPNTTQHHQVPVRVQSALRMERVGLYIVTEKQPTDYKRGHISTSAYGLGLVSPLPLLMHGTDSTEELG